MSDDPPVEAARAALTAALTDMLRACGYLADDGLVTGYVVVSMGISASADGVTGYSMIAPQDQPVHATLGLLTYGRERFLTQVMNRSDDR